MSETNPVNNPPRVKTINVQLALQGQIAGQDPPASRAYLFNRAGKLVASRLVDKGAAAFEVPADLPYRVTVGPDLLAQSKQAPANLLAQLAQAKQAGDDEEDDAEAAGPDGDEPDPEVAEPEDPGAGCEPGPVASTAGAVVPPGLADGASPPTPPPGDPPEPREGAPRELAITPGPALPRAPAAGVWGDGAPPPMTSTALTPTAAAAVAALATRAWECRATWCQLDTPGGRLGLGKPAGPK